MSKIRGIVSETYSEYSEDTKFNGSIFSAFRKFVTTKKKFFQKKIILVAIRDDFEDWEEMFTDGLKDMLTGEEYDVEKWEETSKVKSSRSVDQSASILLKFCLFVLGHLL